MDAPWAIPLTEVREANLMCIHASTPSLDNNFVCVLAVRDLTTHHPSLQKLLPDSAY